jgi:hypothetical protein
MPETQTDTEQQLTETDEPHEFDPGEVPGLFGEEQDDETPAEETPEGETEEGEEAPANFNIDGKEYTSDELKELLEKGSDYTRKTQALAEERKALQQIQSFAEAVTSLPEDAQSQLIEFVQDLSSGKTPRVGAPGLQVPANPEVPSVSWDDLSDEGRALTAAQAAQNAEITALKAALHNVEEVFGEIRGVVEEAQTAKQTAQASEIIKEKFGVTIEPAYLARIKSETGIKDPVKLFEVIRPLLADATAEGTRRAVNKPNVPKGTGRTFDPADVSADEIVSLMMKGYKPISH